MAILYFILAGAGLVMFVFGLTWAIQRALLSDILSFPLTCTEKQITFEKTGKYALCIQGANYIDVKYENVFKITNLTNKKGIHLRENFIKPRFRRDWVMGFEYYNFQITQPDTYKIEINHPKDIKGEDSKLFFGSIFKNTVSNDQLSIIVKETTSGLKLFLSIFFLVIGGNVTLWGIVLGLKFS